MPKGVYLRNASPEQRFWMYVDRRSDPMQCWEWVGMRQKDYGYFRIDSQRIRAHRYVYEVTFGEIPEGMLVLHRCDNPPCCNPAHLFLGTNGDNMADKEAKKRGAVGACVKKSTLTDDDIRVIRIRCASGERHREVARDYGISRAAISYIARRQTWKHVT